MTIQPGLTCGNPIETSELMGESAMQKLGTKWVFEFFPRQIVLRICPDHGIRITVIGTYSGHNPPRKEVKCLNRNRAGMFYLIRTYSRHLRLGNDPNAHCATHNH